MLDCSKLFAWAFLLLSLQINGDSFNTNTFNNHGSVGLINIPSARFYNEGSYGFTLYDGEPDQKATFTASPYNWLEASVFYMNIQGMPYPGFEYQDYKDKGFNFKIRLKEEGNFPAVAIGINDLAGTGYYSSEYVVASYGINNLDIHFGLGWGELNGKRDLKNPLIFLDDSFKNRSPDLGVGGSIDIEKYFSNEEATALFGLSYLLSDNLLLKFERDPLNTPGKIGFDDSRNGFSLGLDYSISNNFLVGLSFERGNYFSLKFSYKNSEKDFSKHQYKSLSDSNRTENKYINFMNTLQNNDIGVKQIVEKDRKIGIQVTQFSHPSLDIIEEIIMTAKAENNIEEEVITNYEIVNLKAVENFDQSFEDGAKVIFKRGDVRGWNQSTRLAIRPFLAAREGFLKGAILLENDNEYIFNDSLTYSSNLKYTLWSNFDDLFIPPVDTYPAQVRSDVKKYLNNFDDNIVIGRAQFDYFLTPRKNHHLMFTAGILEEMFVGAGFEYLWFENQRNYAIGFEAFNARKRDYKLNFGLLDYSNTTAHVNFYYRNYGFIPFDAKISYGEYLAGDVGSTIDVSRRFKNGIVLGFFATSTDVTSEQFGEGSFDKGIYFNIPIFGDLINYSWRPLTKDPGQKLVRRNNLHDLVVRFRKIND